SENNAQSSKHHETAPLFSKEGLGEICFKDSGIQWLGEISEHWEVEKTKFHFDFSKGLTITKESLVDDGIPCVNYGEIHSKFGFEVKPEIHDLKCVPSEYLEHSQFALLKKGDFVFADTSEDVKGSGNFTYLNSNIPTFAGYHTIIARLIQNHNSRFLAYVFNSEPFRNQIRTQIKGVKVFSITQAILKNTFVWLPPIEEQTAITTYLDTETAKIDRLQAKIGESVERLKEYRAALITQVVTGKVKV
ncbi:restriction endonuclease subunit S, partial [Glaesserella sp.]